MKERSGLIFSEIGVGTLTITISESEIMLLSCVGKNLFSLVYLINNSCRTGSLKGDF